jgi:uncharacterized protein
MMTRSTNPIWPLVVVIGLVMTANRLAAGASFTIVTGKAEGTYYALGTELAKALTESLAGVRIQVRPGSTALVNLGMIHSGKIESAFVRSATAYQAFNGTDQFTDKPIAGIRGIASLYPDAVQIVTRSAAHIEAFSDLEGKIVIMGETAGTTALDAANLLRAAGMTPDQFGRIEWLGPADAARMIRDDRADAAFLSSGIPSPTVLELSADAPVGILGLEDALIHKIVETYPFYTMMTIPTDTYVGQTKPVKTVGAMAQWVCAAEVPEDLVYQLTRALWASSLPPSAGENEKPMPPAAIRIAKAHVKGINLTLETALDAMAIPLHPGAERFYREKGRIR